MQSRWAVYNMIGMVELPSCDKMLEEIKTDQVSVFNTNFEKIIFYKFKFQAKISDRFYHSDRLTIQKDPILYNDEISSIFGAKPSIFRNPKFAWRLFLSSCGPAQWRLNGPDADPDAAKIVQSVPITPMMNAFGFLALFLFLLLILAIYNSPYLLLTAFGLSYFIFKQFE
jgi:hypothetical protein